MGFLNLPSSDLVKGQSYEVSVDKTLLASESKVSNDTYFSNNNVWNRFTATFKSSNNPNHQEVMYFDATLPSPISTFQVSDKFIGNMRMISFTIHDFDGGKLEFSRSDLNVSEYSLGMPLKIAPSQLVTNVGSQTQFDVADGSNYQSGFKVRLFNVDTNSFESEEIREITTVIGNVIHIDNSFTTTVVANVHRLRFPTLNKCNNVQASEFYFNS